MNTIRCTAALTASALLILTGCKEQAPQPAPGTPAPGAPAPGAVTAPAMPSGDGHAHGPTVQLGTMTIGAYSVKASFDGVVKPGSDLPIDVWVTAPEGASPVKAVRFWVGSEDAAGSVKARAELEKDNWHTHADIPAAFSPDAKIWVEIENEAGEKSTGGFSMTH